MEDKGSAALLVGAKSASHNPASVDPTRAGWKTGDTPLPVCITVL